MKFGTYIKNFKSRKCGNYKIFGIFEVILPMGRSQHLTIEDVLVPMHVMCLFLKTKHHANECIFCCCCFLPRNDSLCLL